MKRTVPFILFLIGLSIVSGVLLSKASLVGRTGINLFYKEYKFLKIWWQGALFIFTSLLLLLLLQGLVQKIASKRMAKLVHISSIALAFIGLYFTYNDFRHTLSHRLLGERFHLGGYLFLFGWLAISFFYLLKKQPVITNEQPVYR
jgi:hypothetical protein